MIEQTKTSEERMQNELATDRVAAQTFREIFMAYNKPWLQGQLHELFTPRTLFNNRKEIIKQFGMVMDEIQPDVSLTID